MTRKCAGGFLSIGKGLNKASYYVPNKWLVDFIYLDNNRLRKLKLILSFAEQQKKGRACSGIEEVSSLNSNNLPHMNVIV